MYVHMSDYFNSAIRNILTKFLNPYEELSAREKIAIHPNERLVNWTSKVHEILTNITDVEKDMLYDSFIWCSSNLDLRIFDGWIPTDPYFVVEIKPHYIDNIYVADLSIANNYKNNLFKSDQTKNILTDEECRIFIALRGSKLIPLKDYMENGIEFATPQFLIRKSLGFDEINRIYHIKSKYER